MIVSKSSWHYRFLYSVFDKQMETATVCGYCARLVWAIVFTPLAVAVYLVMVPVIWIADKLESKLKGKSICPIGRMNYK